MDELFNGFRKLPLVELRKGSCAQSIKSILMTVFCKRNNRFSGAVYDILIMNRSQEIVLYTVCSNISSIEERLDYIWGRINILVMTSELTKHKRSI